jgi:hypothetical protein
MRFDRDDWKRAFFKTYYEKRSFGNFLVNFNRIWVIHISLFWFYTVYNALIIYQLKRGHSSALTWMILAMSVTYSPCHPSSYGRSYLLHRHCGEPDGRRRIPRSRSRYCPVFHLAPYCLESCPPVGCLATGSRASRASSTSRLQLSRRLVIRSSAPGPGERLFMASCILPQVHGIVPFPS